MATKSKTNRKISTAKAARKYTRSKHDDLRKNTSPVTNSTPKLSFSELSALTRNEILSLLTKSVHGDLASYLQVTNEAARRDPEFLAHLIAWNHQKGQIRDSKIALPVGSLTYAEFPDELAENSFAHIAMLGPRELLRANRFALGIPGRLLGRMRTLRRVIYKNLIDRASQNRFTLLHRHAIKELFALNHLKPENLTNLAIFSRMYTVNSIFSAVQSLSKVSDQEAAELIAIKSIPFIIAAGALGKRITNPDLLLALLTNMTPTQVITNARYLEKLGVMKHPALRAAFEKQMGKTVKGAVLRAGAAAQSLEDEDAEEAAGNKTRGIVATKLRAAQERQLDAVAGIEGNWLVLGDRSGSMELAIDVARQVAAILARQVKGKVELSFFDTTPQSIDVTGATLDTIIKATQYIMAGGGTSIGCGLMRALDEKHELDGIAIISDCQENTSPRFVDVYKRYSEWIDKEVPVYVFRCAIGVQGYMDRDLKQTMNQAGYAIEEFDLTHGKVDYNVLPDYVRMMRSNRYSLIDEIMATPLLTLAEVK